MNRWHSIKLCRSPSTPNLSWTPVTNDGPSRHMRFNSNSKMSDEHFRQEVIEGFQDYKQCSGDGLLAENSSADYWSGYTSSRTSSCCHSAYQAYGIINYELCWSLSTYKYLLIKLDFENYWNNFWSHIQGCILMLSSAICSSYEWRCFVKFFCLIDAETYILLSPLFIGRYPVIRSYYPSAEHSRLFFFGEEEPSCRANPSVAFYSFRLLLAIRCPLISLHILLQRPRSHSKNTLFRQSMFFFHSLVYNHACNWHKVPPIIFPTTSVDRTLKKIFVIIK